MLVFWQGFGNAKVVTMSGAFERVGWGQSRVLKSEDNRIAPVEGGLPQKQHLGKQLTMFVRLSTFKIYKTKSWAGISEQDLGLY